MKYFVILKIELKKIFLTFRINGTYKNVCSLKIRGECKWKWGKIRKNRGAATKIECKSRWALDLLFITFVVPRFL